MVGGLALRDDLPDLIRLTDVAERKEALFEKKLVSPEEIEIARTERNTDKARVDVNQEEVKRSTAAVQSAIDNLRKTTFKSPIDGTVTQLNVERGEIVMVGTMNNPGTGTMFSGVWRCSARCRQ